jgi:hypothetical protein
MGCLWRLSDPPTLVRKWRDEAVWGHDGSHLIRIQPRGLEFWPYETVEAYGFDPPLSDYPESVKLEVPLLDWAARFGEYILGARFENKYLWGQNTGDLVRGFPASNGSGFDFSPEANEFAMAEGFGEPNDVCLVPGFALEEDDKLVGLETATAFDSSSIAVKRPLEAIQVIDLESMDVIATLNQIDSKSRPVGFVQSGRRLIAQDKNGLKLVETETGRVLNEFAFHRAYREAEPSRDGTRLVLVLDDPDEDLLDERELVVLSTDTFRVIHREEIERSSDALHPGANARFSDDDRWCGIVPDYNTLHLYDTRTWRCVRVIPEQHFVIGFLADNREILTWDTKAMVVKTSLDTWESEGLFHTVGGQTQARLSPDHRTIIMGGWDGVLRFWKLDNGFLLGETDLRERISAVDIALNGRPILTFTENVNRSAEPTGSLNLRYHLAAMSTEPTN